MGVEIERKFLVKDDSFKSEASSSYDIRQGYLNKDPERTVRIRICGDKGFLTVKGLTHGIARKEFEYEIPFSDALEMLDLCEGNVLSKTRYIINFEGMKWEVDEFHGKYRGLTLAEVELPYENYEVTIPDFVDREVTGDSQYYNSSLI